MMRYSRVTVPTKYKLRLKMEGPYITLYMPMGMDIDGNDSTPSQYYWVISGYSCLEEFQAKWANDVFEHIKMHYLDSNWIQDIIWTLPPEQ